MAVSEQDKAAAAEFVSFDTLRRRAMLAPALDPVRLEVADQLWAEWGRKVNFNMENPKFLIALRTALTQAENEGSDEITIPTLARRLRVYLMTGTIAR